jgi:hypothetical protein
VRKAAVIRAGFSSWSGPLEYPPPLRDISGGGCFRRLALVRRYLLQEGRPNATIFLSPICAHNSFVASVIAALRSASAARDRCKSAHKPHERSLRSASIMVYRPAHIGALHAVQTVQRTTRYGPLYLRQSGQTLPQSRSKSRAQIYTRTRGTSYSATPPSKALKIFR